MTSALVGLRLPALMAEDDAGTECADADADADAGAGADAVGGRASLLRCPGALLETAGEIVGTGTELSGCAVQPEITARAAAAAQRIRRVDRRRGRWDRILLLTIGRPSARTTVPS
jgi:hypothetical protein